MEEVGELRGKVRGYEVCVEDMQGRIKELVGANEKFKIEVAGLGQYKSRTM